MAGLVEGVQYGLSSHGNFHENKSLIFVRLTDSAYRAIEVFLRNKVMHIIILFINRSLMAIDVIVVCKTLYGRHILK
jgi:hypothetical protein